MPNPSFEVFSVCPNSENQMYLATPWKNNGASPDFYSSCDIYNEVGVPYNDLGFQYAAFGESYAGLFAYWESVPNLREYIGVQLTTALIPETRYYISFKVSAALFPDIGLANVYVNNLGMLFTCYERDSTQWFAVNKSHLLCNSIVSDTVNWTVIKGSFVADSAYSYLIIGGMLDDSLTDIDSITAINPFNYEKTAYYYIDNVCVTSDSLFNESYITGNQNSFDRNRSIKIFPNPATDYFLINSNGEKIEGIEVCNIVGSTVKNYNVSDLYSISDLARGLYLVKIKVNGQEQVQKIILTP